MTAHTADGEWRGLEKLWARSTVLLDKCAPAPLAQEREEELAVDKGNFAAWREAGSALSQVHPRLSSRTGLPAFAPRPNGREAFGRA